MQRGASFSLLRRAVLAWLPAKNYSAGLFGRTDLGCPEDFAGLVNKVRGDCGRLLEEACAPNRQRKIVEVLDEMSNTICIAADTSECIRLLHPEATYRDAAETAVASLGTLIEQLNTSRRLYECVERVVRHGDVVQLDAVDRRVTEMLHRDFVTSGVQLESVQREEFVNLSQQIFLAGAQFMRGCEEPVFLPGNAVPASLKAQVKDDQLALHSPLFDSTDPGVRRFGYFAYFRPSGAQEALLRNLISGRRRLALLVGDRSYADRSLRPMLLDSSAKAVAFLETALDAVRDQARREMTLLKQYGTPGCDVHVWDVPYLTFVARQKMFKLNVAPGLQYIPLNTLIANLSILLERLYGVRVEAQPTGTGEVWHVDVAKLVVYDHSGHRLGVVYCDWFDRPGKVAESHFTVQCSKQMPDGSSQTPVVVLTFRLHGWHLSQMQLENVLHEVGHALHSLFGSTRYQHVAGTRCATDFAEVPSNLMERWASNRALLLALSGNRMASDLADNLCSSRRAFGAVELAQQALMALADLRLHLDFANGDTVQFVQRIYDEAGFGDWMPEGSAWHHRFGHLVPYGSKYSSYLVAKAVASLLWHDQFESDPLNSYAGESWRTVQSFGGELSSAELLRRAIGFVPSVKNLAMALVRDVSYDVQTASSK